MARGGRRPAGPERRPRDREQAVRRRAVHRGHGRPDGRRGMRRGRRWRRWPRQHVRHVSAGPAVGPQTGHAQPALLPGGRLGLGDIGHGHRGARHQQRAPVVHGRHAEVRGRQVRTADRRHRLDC